MLFNIEMSLKSWYIGETAQKEEVATEQEFEEADP